jgi:phospholipid transport system substrate-binding protein
MRRLLRTGGPVLLVLLIAAGSTAAWAASEQEARQLVERTADRMLVTLKSRRADIERNPLLINRLVNSILAPHFDFEMITRAAVGPGWRQADAAQQEALIDAFRGLLVRTYSKALLRYSDEEIVYESVRPGTRAGTVIVPTLVRAPGAAPIPMDYRMHDKSGVWKVYDVVIENVSLISNYRSQFRATIARSGVDGLIDELRAKNAGGG